MALENPVRPSAFREQTSDGRRSIRASADAPQFSGDGVEREDPFRSSTRIDMKQIVSAGKVRALTTSVLTTKCKCRPQMSISPSSRDVVMASYDSLLDRNQSLTDLT